ncbi:YihY family inner membrane protein [Roseovarius atlanticus]|uniref:YihY family inner membrane protein n=1 Tax=Roseovarius atlanticus TaxID=1641875 RepID=UPI001C943DE0|nr:YihY family inner membrane protein [Roseovarius atlanticus]MBY5989544.1 YihY family inner membrane protein [Roseovarius atlanticus]MBY6124936.1 YihY family inner membrane protein [Roseovarius atlanticus]MBY6149431.1 YihY family inner membrane protein [Roseovarius atlanticus]
MAEKKSRLDYWRETRFLGIVSDIGSFLYYTMRRFVSDGLGQAAGALTYSTLLALVPLLVIAFAVLSGFPAFDPVKIRMQEMFFGILIPEVGSDVRTYISDFTSNASDLTVAGIIALPVTAVLLLSTIEATLNQVWRVSRPRPLVVRLLTFWAVLTMGPLLIGASFTLTTDMMRPLQDWARDAGYIPAVQLRADWPRKVLALVNTTIVFTLLYCVVPAVQVRIRNAVIGGAFAAVAFQVLQWGFNTFVTSSSTYSTVYGAVAIFPIFLLWVYSSWTVIILGALLAASFPDWWRRRDALSGEELSPAETLEVAVALLAALARKAPEGKSLPPDDLAEAVPVLARDSVLQALLDANYIVETEDAKLCLARDLHRVSVAELAHDIGLTLGGVRDLSGRPSLSQVIESTGTLPDLLARLRKAEDDILDQPIASVIAGRDPDTDNTSGAIKLY